MKRYFLMFMICVVLVNQHSFAFASSSSVPVPKPVGSEMIDTAKYASASAVAAWLYYNYDYAVETTEDFYRNVSAAYDVLAPAAKQALSDAFSAAQDGIVDFSSDALNALKDLANSVFHNTAVDNGATVTRPNRDALPSSFYQRVNSEQSYYLRYPDQFGGDSISTYAIGGGILYIYSSKFYDYYGVIAVSYVTGATEIVLPAPGGGYSDANTPLQEAIRSAEAKYGPISSAPPAVPVPPALEGGFRFPLSLEAGAGAYPVVRNGKVAVPAVPDRVVHEYPDGAKDVAFNPVFPDTSGGWVNRDGIPVPRDSVTGIPVPLDPSVPWNRDVPTYRVPDGTVVTNPDGTISIPDGIAWDAPIPDVVVPPVDPPVPPVPVPAEGEFDFRPLLLVGEQLTRKFPFSIPWDLKRQIAVFNVEPTAPKLNIDYTFDIGGVQMHPKWAIDLSFLDPFASFGRWALTIVIDIAFILMLRRLLPE